MSKPCAAYLIAMIFFLPCIDALAQDGDPFGSDPFGGDADKPAAADTDPFGAPTEPATTNDNPFGDTKTPVSPAADPFDNANDAAEADDPFGGKTKPAEKAMSDPFGGGRPTPAAIRPAVKAKPRKDLLPKHEVNERIRRVLSDETRVTFVETPLADAVAMLSQDHDIPVLLNKRALEELGLTEDTPVDIDLSGVSLRSVLKIMLTPLDCTFIVKDEVLQITTLEHAEQNPVLRSYTMDEELAPRAEKIVNAMTSTVVPDAWEDKGGPCSVSPVDHVLMVSATEAVHEEVENFMTMLEDAFSKRKYAK